MNAASLVALVSALAAIVAALAARRQAKLRQAEINLVRAQQLAKLSDTVRDIRINFQMASIAWQVKMVAKYNKTVDVLNALIAEYNSNSILTLALTRNTKFAGLHSEIVDALNEMNKLTSGMVKNMGSGFFSYKLDVEFQKKNSEWLREFDEKVKQLRRLTVQLTR